MNHVRFHAITGDPILYIDHRRKPNGYIDGHCPFCHPSESIKQVYPVGDDAISVWDNLYPVVPEGMAQELVVESRVHDRMLGQHSEEAIAVLLWVIRERMNHLYDHPGVVYVSMFRNWGRQSGGTQPHPHSQLYALPFVPPAIEREREGFQRLRREAGCCPICREIDGMVPERLVAENEWAMAFAPYASLHPFEMWVTPRRHVGAFESIPDDVLAGMAAVLHRAVGALEKAIDGRAYNIILCHDRDENYHLRFLVFARIFTSSGFVIGTGAGINGLDPERAVALLRGV
ncbi:MAG: DUF4931 domain-containing protein [Kyrpidia tusciae]|nr:DUF4931 domain-containing protein [Kyrpidia tusciae]MBE3551440.1 DUF4931 domain-containing protein [Kyrpidia tusciae]